MCTVLGGILLLSGLLYVATWFAGREKKSSSSILVIPGVILCGLGVWLMLSSDSVISLIQYVFGAILVFHGFLDIQGAIALASYKANKWWFDFLLGLGTLGLGVAVLLNPFGSFSALITVIGLALVYDGFTDLWLILRLTFASRAHRKALEAAEAAAQSETTQPQPQPAADKDTESGTDSV
jgi:uncharacterized membrane protein HdeD (DUF308 family)